MKKKEKKKKKKRETNWLYSLSLKSSVAKEVLDIHVRWIFGNGSLVLRQVFDVVVVEPLDFEMKVHIGGRLAESLLFVLFQSILHVDGKLSPHGVR